MEMFKSLATWLLIIFILGVSYIGALEHKKNATDERSQITLHGLQK